MAEERKIKGFGAKAGGKKLVHIICEDGGAMCDKRLTGFEDVITVLTKVTCPKCKGYSAYKYLMLGFSEGDDLKDIRETLEEANRSRPETGAPKAKGKKEPVKKEPVKKEPVKKEPVYPPKGPKENKKDTKRKVEAPAEKREDWSLLWSEDKASCDILHKPTQKILFENIKGNIALAALNELNKINIYWLSEADSVPKDFVSTIRSVVGRAYKKTGNKIPENLVRPIRKKGAKKKKEKPKEKARVIKRRDKVKKAARVIKRRSSKGEKEGKRTIKRRSDKPKKEVHIITTMFGRRELTPGFTVIQLLNDGMTMQRMIKTLMKKHSLSEDKARGKIKGIIRTTARKKGIPIIIKLAKKERNDLYGLAEKIE